jgi:hypothetical protein
MRSPFLSIIILCSVASYVNAHVPDAYYFKATIITLDTTITGYFYLPYESLPDSILTRFKSDNEYFRGKIKSDSYQNGLVLYSFLLNYRFETAENDTSYVLCKSRNTIHFKWEEIIDAVYHDVIIYSSHGNALYSEINSEDLEWLKKSPTKVITDTSEECLHQYFILYETNPEINKIIEEILQIRNLDDTKRNTLGSRLNDFKIIYITRHRCV